LSPDHVIPGVQVQISEPVKRRGLSAGLRCVWSRATLTAMKLRPKAPGWCRAASC
jgi:hypothetical protein